LAAGLRPNPLGELTALPQTPGFRREGRGGREGRVGMGRGRDGRDGEGRDRPAHFLVASAAYDRCAKDCVRKAALRFF